MEEDAAWGDPGFVIGSVTSRLGGSSEMELNLRLRLRERNIFEEGTGRDIFVLRAALRKLVTDERRWSECACLR